MQTTQHSNTRCPIYLPPFARSNPAGIEAIQHRTDTNPKGRTKAVQPVVTVAADVSIWPFGGDSA